MSFKFKYQSHHYLNAIISSLLILIWVNCDAQTSRDSMSLFSITYHAQIDQKDLNEVLKKAKDREKDLADNLLREYERFIIRNDGLEGQFHLYSLMSENEKKAATQIIFAKTEAYLKQANMTLDRVAEIQATTKLPYLNQSAEKLKKYVIKGRDIVRQYTYKI